MRGVIGGRSLFQRWNPQPSLPAAAKHHAALAQPRAGANLLVLRYLPESGSRTRDCTTIHHILRDELWGRFLGVPPGSGGLSIRLPPLDAPSAAVENRQHRLRLAAMRGRVVSCARPRGYPGQPAPAVCVRAAPGGLQTRCRLKTCPTTYPEFPFPRKPGANHQGSRSVIDLRFRARRGFDRHHRHRSRERRKGSRRRWTSSFGHAQPSSYDRVVPEPRYRCRYATASGCENRASTTKPAARTSFKASRVGSINATSAA